VNIDFCDYQYKDHWAIVNFNASEVDPGFHEPFVGIHLLTMAIIAEALYDLSGTKCCLVMK
jgi:hypothetical protein